MPDYSKATRHLSIGRLRVPSVTRHRAARVGNLSCAVAIAIGLTATGAFAWRIRDVPVRAADIDQTINSQFSGLVGSFYYASNPCDFIIGGGPGFKSVMNWGDGTSSAATVVGLGYGFFSVFADHAYRKPGSYGTRINVIDCCPWANLESCPDPNNPGKDYTWALQPGYARASISDAALVYKRSPAFIASPYQTVRQPIATFSYPFASSAASYTATVNWGQFPFNKETAAVVARPDGHTFDVVATHGYSALPHTASVISVEVTHAGGAPTQFTQWAHLLRESDLVVTGALADGAGALFLLAPDEVYTYRPQSVGRYLFRTGGDLISPTAIASDRMSGSLYVMDPAAAAGAGAVIRLDPPDYGQTILTSGLPNLTALAVLKNGNPVVISDGSLYELHRMTGQRSLRASGGELARAIGIAPLLNDSLVIVTRDPAGTPSVTRIDLATGVQSVITTGGYLTQPSAIAQDSSGALFVADLGATDTIPARIVAVDSSTGTQRLVAEGGALSAPTALSFGADGALLVLDSIAGDGRGNLIQVNPQTGALTPMPPAPLQEPFGPVGASSMAAIGGSCGDGRRQVSLGEQCDDGNNVEGDGCSARCRVTPLYSKALRIDDPANEPYSNFGATIVPVENSIVVGAPGYRDTGAWSQRGQAYIVPLDGTASPTLLTNLYPDSSDNFGASLAVDPVSRRVFVGAPHAGYEPWFLTNASGSGAVYIYDLDTGAYIGTLPNPNVNGYPPFRSDAFGWRLAVVPGPSTLIAVAAPFDSNATGGIPQAGAVYVFDAQTGLPVRTLTSPAPRTSGHFGLELLSDANCCSPLTIVEGTGLRDDGQSGSMVHMFASPTLTHLLTSPLPMVQTLGLPLAWGRFQYPPAQVSPYDLLVGNPNAYVGTVQSGTVTHGAINEIGAVWTDIPDPAPTPSGSWGWAMASSENHSLVAIGAQSQQLKGAVHLLETYQSGAVVETLTPPDSFGQAFGKSVSVLSGAASIPNGIAVGMGNPVGFHRVYVFDDCNDGIKTATEECDGLANQNVPNAACRTDCRLRRCGDGIVDDQYGERCDDGNTRDGDGCDSDCEPTACGNGIVTWGEQCDEGTRNGQQGSGCTADCRLSVATVTVSPGTQVAVSPTPDVSVTFSTVNAGGALSVALGGGPSGLPATFRVAQGAQQYEISSTAAWSGPVEVCIRYGIGDFADASNLQLMHYENGAWVAEPVTSALDPASRQVCGTVYSFSPFVLAETAPIPAFGSSELACLGSIQVNNPTNNPLLDRRGTTNSRQTCIDGDQTCDMDRVRDGKCTVRVGVCLDQADSRFPTCAAQGISAVEIKKPLPGRKGVDGANGQSLATSMMGIGARQGGKRDSVLTFVPPVVVSTCTQGADVEVPLGLRKSFRLTVQTVARKKVALKADLECR